MSGDTSLVWRRTTRVRRPAIFAADQADLVRDLPLPPDFSLRKDACVNELVSLLKQGTPRKGLVIALVGKIQGSPGSFLNADEVRRAFFALFKSNKLSELEQPGMKLIARFLADEAAASKARLTERSTSLFHVEKPSQSDAPYYYGSSGSRLSS